MDILSIDIAGQTAVARVRDGYLGLVFLDTLSFIHCEGEWRIINKLFHVES
ncbi:MAG: nuclear transport factor 2 family protein [Luminiphilus sp.]